jgi:hypothetical protein
MRKSCIANDFEGKSLFFQTNQNAIAINVYKTDHTGPNNQEGGLNDGLFIVMYQVCTDWNVAQDPKNATKKHNAIEIINFKILLIPFL